MTLRSQLLMLMIASVLACNARAQESNALPALEGLVRQWVELRSQVATEDRAWLEQERQWQTEIALYEKEQAALNAEIKAASQEQQTHDQAQLELATRAENLQSALGSIQPALDRAEADLRHWTTRIPAALMPPLAEAFERLPVTHAESVKIPTPRRAQLVVALYAQIEDLDRRVHAVKELLDDGSGGRREMDVLYLGLARGYAVSPDGAWAAVGIPTAEGWTWTPQPAIAKSINNLVSMQRRERTAALMSLPLQIVDVKQ